MSAYDFVIKRAERLTAIATENAKHLQLVDVEEIGNLGRYYLRPSLCGGYTWAEVVVLRGGSLLVHGDCDTVVFSSFYKPSHPRQVVDWMATDNYGYAEEKASIGGSKARCWDDEVARAAVLSWRRERRITHVLAERLMDAISDSGPHGFQIELYRNELYELGSDVYEVTEGRVFGAQAVLRRLKAQLAER